MVKLRFLLLFLLTTVNAFAEIIITSSTVNLSAANTQLIAKLDSTLNDLFYGIASLAGPGIINAAAFSSTMGIQRQQENLPRFQLEPSLGIITPGKSQGDERLGALPLYAASIVGGFRLDEKNAIQLRGFYLPTMNFTVQATQLSFQPYNLGVAWIRQIKPAGKEWYNPAILTPLDLAYMHGMFSARFSGVAQNFSFDPTGDGSQGSAKANFAYTNDFRLQWDVYSLSTGMVFTKSFLWIFNARLGFLASMHLGNSSLTNTAIGIMQVTASAAVGGNEFKLNDTATIEIRNRAKFKPVLVSNQICLGLGINLFGVTLNLDLLQNLQINATAVVVQLGFWF